MQLEIYHMFSINQFLVRLVVLIPSLLNQYNFCCTCKVFQDESTIFNHIAIHKDLGNVYIGATNIFYHLSPDLEKISALSTRSTAIDEFNNCLKSNCKISSKRACDNVNKLLLIDYLNSRLIICSTVYDGIYITRDVVNVSKSCEYHPLVVSKNASDSSVAFISSGTSGINLLQVAVGNDASAKPPERPSLSSRNLQKPLPLFEIAANNNSKMFIKDKWTIQYVYGFSSAGYSYFLSNEKNLSTSESPLTSRIARLDRGDTDFKSYIDVQIECTSQGKKSYNEIRAAYFTTVISELLEESRNKSTVKDALLVVFSEGTGSNSADSVLCMYRLHETNKLFRKERNTCSMESGNTGMSAMVQQKPCKETYKKEDLSNKQSKVLPKMHQSLSKAISEKALYKFQEVITAITATSVDDCMVIFVGTKGGHLKKILFEKKDKVIELCDIEVDQGSPVNSDLILDSNGDHIYVMTKTKVTKMGVQECDKHSTCQDCLLARDPYCGWCMLENKCDLKRNCDNKEMGTQFWIPYKVPCPEFTIDVISSNYLPSAEKFIRLRVNHHLSLSGRFLCEFSLLDKVLVTNGTPHHLEIFCDMPNWNKIAPIHETNLSTGSLSVSTVGNRSLWEANIALFNCASYNSCDSCLSGPFSCAWCTNRSRCTFNGSEGCSTVTKNGTDSCTILTTTTDPPTVAWESKTTQDLLHNCVTFNSCVECGFGDCGWCISTHRCFDPRTDDCRNNSLLNKTTGCFVMKPINSSEILVPAGTKKSIQMVTFLTLPKEDLIKCKFHWNDQFIESQAKYLDEQITCNYTNFSYNQSQPNMKATFQVLLNNDQPLYNPDNIHIVIYKCELMANDENNCSKLNSKYDCKWCSVTKRCEVSGLCDAKVYSHPSISFSPEKGPLEGGTRIVIKSNTSLHIYTKITVAGSPCDPIPYSNDSQEIMCSIHKADNNITEGPVIVSGDGLSFTSIQRYTFVDPKIANVSFSTDGYDTLLNIVGENLNAASSTRVSVDNLVCSITSTTSDKITCTADGLSTDGSVRDIIVRIQLDNAEKMYQINNTGTVQEPLTVSLKTIPAGGITVTIPGTNFTALEEPLLRILDERNASYDGPCKVLNSTMVTCRTPYIPNFENSSLDERSPKSLKCDFKKLNRTARVPNRIHLYPNPTFNEFSKDASCFATDYLILSGRNIGVVCKKSDVVVKVGDGVCNVSMISESQLVCILPKHASPELHYANVTVSIGEYFTVAVGKCSYTPQQSFTMMEVVVLSVVVGTLVLTVLVMLYPFLGILRIYWF